MKQALKLMAVAQQALDKADRRMTYSMDADCVNVPLHRSAECLECAIAAGKDYLSKPRPGPAAVQRAD
jgi:hypothetical protein